MAQVASVDYATRRVYLHADTVSLGFDPMAAYQEIKALRRTTPAHRLYRPLLVGEGRVPKGGGRYTPRYVVMYGGAVFVPQDVDHTLEVSVELMTDAGQDWRSCFSLAPLSPGVAVNIWPTWQQNEVIEVNVSGAGPLTVEQAAALARLDGRVDVAVSSRAAPGQGLTSAQALELLELWRLAGLDPAVALQVAAAYRRAGTGIRQTVGEAAGVVTVTREDPDP